MKNSDSRFGLTSKIILYILPILAFAGVVVPLIVGESNLALLGSYIAASMFIAPIIYKKYYKDIDMVSNMYSSNQYVRSDVNWFLLLLIFYSLCFTISVIILVAFDIRPLIYYLTIILMAIAIISQILLFNISNKKVIIILAQIMMLALNMVWGVTLKYYYFIERTDPIAHAWYISNLLNNGNVTGLFDLYQQFPLWHIMVAISYIILNLSIPIYKMMYFIHGINFAIIILVIYLISLKMFKNNKLALISSLFVAFNSDLLFFGMSSLPRSVVAFFEVILILLLLDVGDFRKGFLMIILTIILIMYHTVSMPFILSILFIMYILQKFYSAGTEKVLGNYILLAIIATLTYWIYFASNLFEVIIGYIFDPAVSGTMTKSIVYTPLNELFNYLQYSMLLFFIIIGVLSILTSKRFFVFNKIFAMAVLLLAGITFPGPALLLNKLASNLNLGRFSEYSSTLITIIGAVGFAGIYYSAGKKLKIIITIFLITMFFLSISNDFNASDNPLVKRTYYTFYLKEEETTAFNHIANVTEGYVMSDYVTRRYLEFSPYKSKSHYLEVDMGNKLLRNNNSDIILIRDQELNKRPLRFLISTTGEFQLHPNEQGAEDYYFQDSSLWKDLERYSKIYDSGGVSGFN